MVHTLDMDKDGSMSAKEVKSFVARLLGQEEKTIPANHAEVTALVGLSTAALVSKLIDIIPRPQIDIYHQILCPEGGPMSQEEEDKLEQELKPLSSLFTGAGGEHWKVVRLCEALDPDGDGLLDEGPCCQLVGFMQDVDTTGRSGKPVSPRHGEVKALVGLNTQGLIDVAGKSIDRFYEAIFPDGDDEGLSRIKTPADPKKRSLFAAVNSCERWRVVRIVEALDQDGDGMMVMEEVKRLFSRLLDTPEKEIPDDHPEVRSFVNISTEEFIQKLSKISKTRLEKFYSSLFGPDAKPIPRRRKILSVSEASLLNPRPQRAKVLRIVEAIDTSSDGQLCLDEVKQLFSKLLMVPVDEIPDTHREIKAFAGLKTGELVELLCTTISQTKVDSFYRVLFAEEFEMETEQGVLGCTVYYYNIWTV